MFLNENSLSCKTFEVFLLAAYSDSRKGGHQFENEKSLHVEYDVAQSSWAEQGLDWL